MSTPADKTWRTLVKYPFLLAFAVWVSTQIYTLKTEAALANQERTAMVKSMDNDRQLLKEIRDQQIKVLIALERLVVSFEKEFPKK